MKLGRIKALCKARQYVELFDRRDGKQFLSDGCGVWPVDEKLPLTEEVVRTIFEITTRKWSENWSFQHIRFGEDDDAENCGMPECLLEDFWAPGTETELMTTRERILMMGEELQLFATADGQERYLWASTEQFSACPDNARLFALRTAPDTTRAIAVYDDMFLGGLIRVLGTGQQLQIANTLRGLSEKEVI